MEKFDVIVVGAGLAGLAAAYTLAKDGIETLVLERGDYPGAKNVTGGRIYLEPIKHFFPEEFWEKAPLERPVTTELITLMAEASSTTLRFRAQAFAQQPYQSYTIQRGKFDRWFGNQVANVGAILVTKSRVDDLIWENGRVVGVIAGGEELGANVVLASDGVLSLVAEKAGLRQPAHPVNFAVGFKETIELSEKTIEERFSLAKGEGAAQLFMGSLTQNRFGGGFLYTNKNSISLGMVVGIHDLMEKQPLLPPPLLLEELKQRPEVAAVIADGEMVEYSAHVIPEAGYGGIGPLYGEGILVAGDAAGFALNMGITVRGMEFAIASGVLAARAIKRAFERKDYSANSLAVYQQYLEESFILKDMRTFKEAPHILKNPRFFSYYPDLVGSILQELFSIGTEPKKRLAKTIWSKLSFSDLVGILKDTWRIRKL